MIGDRLSDFLRCADNAAIILYVSRHPGCPRSEIYRRVSRNAHTRERIDSLISDGLVVSEDGDRCSLLTLTERGERLASLLREADSVLGGRRSVCSQVLRSVIAKHVLSRLDRLHRKHPMTATFDVLSDRYTVSILVFIHGHGPCTKMDIYRNVSRNQSVRGMLDRIEGAGLLTQTVLRDGRTVKLELTPLGEEVAERLCAIRDLMERRGSD